MKEIKKYSNADINQLCFDAFNVYITIMFLKLKYTE